MSVYQLRTYTLATAEDADAYATVHWARHVSSLAGFGVVTRGVWRAGEATVVALVSYEDGVDPAEADRAFMASEAFRSDMAGFPMDAIRGVDAVQLTPAPISPLV